MKPPLRLIMQHLAPYLCHELRVKRFWNETQAEMLDTMQTLCYDDDCITFANTPDFYLDNDNESDFKPILRPMSDLVKEIEQHGRKFIPIIELHDVKFNTCLTSNDCLGSTSHDSYGKVYACETSISKIEYAEHFQEFKCSAMGLDGDEHFAGVNYQLFQKLFEWHFDVFGLINTGLAIDINTIKE